MSLDLSVLMPERISERLAKSVDDFLIENGFYEDVHIFENNYVYRCRGDGINIDVHVDLKPEEDEYWGDGEDEAIGFMPMTEFMLEARHSEKSFKASYLLAKGLAEVVNGVIWDHQVGVVYDSDAKPYANFRTDDKVEEYGAGMDLFMDAVGCVKDILNVN
jgi:hypothetical protein